MISAGIGTYFWRQDKPPIYRIILVIMRIIGGIGKDVNRITERLAPATTAINAITLAATI